MYENTDYYLYYDYNRAIILALFLSFREKEDGPKRYNYSKWSHFTEKIYTSDIVGFKGMNDIFYHISNLISHQLIQDIKVHLGQNKFKKYYKVDDINILREKYKNNLDDIEILTQDIDIKRLSLLMSQYIERWKNTEQLFHYSQKNFFTWKEQIKAVKLALQEKYRAYKHTVIPIGRTEIGVPLNQDGNTESTVDILGCLLYLQSEKELKITDIDINDTVRFYVEVNSKILQRIYFDIESGKVYVDEKKIGQIKVGNQEYKLFKLLYENAGDYKTYNDIKEYIAPGLKISETNQQFVSNKKRQLQKPVRELIKPGNKCLVLDIIT